MKNFFTKAIYFIAAIILFMGVSLHALAQHTAATLESGNNASAIAKDGSGNIYVLRIKSGTGTIGGGATAEIVKYVGGTGSAINIASNIPDEDQSGDWATGMAVASNGDVYYITDNGGAVTNGNIMKLTYQGGNSYSAPAVFKAGTGTQGFYTALAMDNADHLYAVQYDFNGDSNRNGIGSYTVIEFTSLASNTYTTLYQKLGEPGLDNAQNGSSSVSYTVPTGLAINAGGDVFVSDGFSQGASINDGGKIIKLTKSSAYAASTISTGFSATSLALDAAGNLFASQGTSTTVPATSYGLYEYTGATATQSPTLIYSPLHEGGSLYPFGIAIINDNDIFVTDGEDPATSFSNKVLQIFGVPATQASNVSFTSITATAATASWTNGDGTKRAVFIKNASSGNPTPVNSTTYTANTTFASGTQIAATGWYCIFNGTGSTVNITGLTAGQTYQVMAVEYNGLAGSENYDQSTATNNPNSFTAQSPTTINSINRVTGATSNLATVNFTAVFGVAVTGVTASNFSVTATGVSGVTNANIGTPTTSDNITWTVPVSTGTGDGTIQLNLSNATGLSKSISTSLPFAGQSYTIDKTSPTISISAPSLSATNAGPVTYTVTYADANFNSSTLADGNITLSTTGTASGTPVVTGSGLTRTVTISGITGDGTLGISIAAGTATDLAGNTAPAAGPSTTFNVDNIVPTVTIARTDGNPIKETTLDFQAVFSEPVTGVDGSAFTLTTTGGVTSGAISVTPLNSTTFNITVINVNGTGTGRLDLNGSGTSITDAAGNTPAGFAGGEVYTIDQTVPTVASINIAGTSPTKATSVDYTVTFSEAVTGVDAADFTVTQTSGAANGSVTGVTGSGTTYTVTVGSVSGNGDLRLDLNASSTAIVDGAGNPISGGFTTGQTYTIDNTPPTLTSGSYFSNNGFSSQYAKVGDNITLSIGYNDVLQSLVMTIGGNPVSVTPSNGNRNWTGVLTTTSADIDGNVPWTLSATDLAGNVRNYSNTDFGTVLIFDKTPPVPIISAPTPAVAGTGSATTVTYNVNYADANFNFSTLSTSDITVNSTGTANGTLSLSGSGSSYQVTFSNLTGLGTLRISIGANTGQDIPGNLAIASDPSAAFTVASTNVLLTNLTINPKIPLFPVSGPDYKDYTALVGNSVSSVTITPTDPDVTNTITVNNVGVASGTASAAIPLNEGVNTITTIATAQDGVTTKTYSIKITRLRPSVLTNLTISPATTLLTVPGPDYRDYTATVGNSVSSVTVTPSNADGANTITVNNVPVPAGMASGSIPLNEGDNTIVTVVNDGVTSNTYSIKLTRLVAPLLTKLTISPSAPLYTVPGVDYKDYIATVGNSVSSVTINPTGSNAAYTIKVNNVVVASGTASAAIPLNVGDNFITTIITDGVISNTYGLKITRLGPVTLTNLEISPTAILNLAPGPDYKDYTGTVGNSVSSVTVTPTTPDATNTIKVNNVTVASGSASGAIPLNVGDNIITTVVTDGITSNTYSIKLTRLSPVLLTKLEISPSTILNLVPGLDYKDYTATVVNSVSSVTVTPTSPDETNTITVNNVTVASGTASGAIALNVGDNVINTIVSDGTNTKTYSITITRLAPAILTTLKVNPTISLSPSTGPNYKDYNSTVANSISSVTITPTAGDPSNIIKVNTVTVASGATSAAIPLNVGDNTITTTVSDGVTSNTYSIKITRLAPPAGALAFEENSIASKELLVHQNVSPNGDGNSDVLVIDGIAAYPDNTLQIMNRSGALVYEAKGYDNTSKVFDGHSTNGKLQQAGTYFYSLDYKDGEETKHKTGYLVLKY